MITKYKFSLFFSAFLLTAFSTASYAQIVSETSHFIDRYIPGGRQFTKRVKLLKDMAFAEVYSLAGDDHLDSAQTNAVLDTIRYAPDFQEMPTVPLVNSNPAAWKFESLNLPLQDEHLPVFVEGVWFPIRTYDSDLKQKLIWYTRVRQDRTGQFVEIFAYDLKKLNLGYCSGPEDEYPDVENKRRFKKRQHFGCNAVPQAIADSNLIVGVFRGGYQLYDSATPDWTPFGIVSDGVTEVPSTVGLVGIGVTPDNRVVMAPYQDGQTYKYYRQNGFAILRDGKVTDTAICEQIFYDDSLRPCGPREKELGEYGLRQAVGESKDGHWLFVARSLSISTQSLAKGLADSGAHDAILLDQHVGEYITNVSYTYPSSDFAKRVAFEGFNKNSFYEWSDARRFFKGSERRDFFYVYKK